MYVKVGQPKQVRNNYILEHCCVWLKSALHAFNEVFLLVLAKVVVFFGEASHLGEDVGLLSLQFFKHLLRVLEGLEHVRRLQTWLDGPVVIALVCFLGCALLHHRGAFGVAAEVFNDLGDLVLLVDLQDLGVVELALGSLFFFVDELTVLIPNLGRDKLGELILFLGCEGIFHGYLDVLEGF